MKPQSEIVEALAREKRVEQICANVCKRPASALTDLVQTLYAYLLTMPAPLLQDLYENGQVNFYIVRMVKNQFYSRNSRYYRENIDFAARSTALRYKDYEKADT